MTVLPQLKRDLIEAATHRGSPAADRASRAGFLAVGLSAAVAVGVALVLLLTLSPGKSRDVAASPAGSGPVQHLADGFVSCYLGNRPHSRLGFREGATGQSPTAICRREYRLNDQAATGVAASSLALVACRHAATTVAVYLSDGGPGQCPKVGDRPLPTGYVAALRRLRTLDASLAALPRASECVSASRLAAQTRDVLVRLGFDDWRVRLPAPDPGVPARTGGRCAGFVLVPWENPSDAAPQITPSRRMIYLQLGPPRKLAARLYHVSTQLYQETYRRCYTAASIRALIGHALAGTGLQPRYATNAVMRGDHFDPASERLYQRGCVRFATLDPGTDLTFADVQLQARSAPPPPRGASAPPATAFHPATAAGASAH